MCLLSLPFAVLLCHQVDEYSAGGNCSLGGWGAVAGVALAEL